MENMDKGTHCTKIGADSLAENTPEFICQFVCPSPKDLGFNEKRFHRASVVRESVHLVEWAWRNAQFSEEYIIWNEQKGQLKINRFILI